jgi:hypothetical protein
MIVVKKTLIAVAPLFFTLATLAGTAGNGNEGSRQIQLKESVVLSGVTIVPGPYTLSWSRERGSDEVRITIAHGRKVLATATGRWVESELPSPYEALVYQTARGANELTGILFQHSSESIRVDGNTARADSGQSQGTETN